MQQASAKASL